MEKNIKRILCSFIIFVFILATSTFALEIEVEEAEYTEAYEEYMQLSDEEKAELIEPRKYAIKNTYNSTNDVLIANGTVSLKSYINYLRSTATSSDEYFSLKNIISNNLSIRDQQETGICWAFATLSSLETNLALQDYYNNNNTEGTTVYDYSEMHMAYSKTQMYSDKTNEYGMDGSAADGGTTYMSTSYLTDGQGAVSEDELPFVNDDTTKVESSTVEDLDAETTVTSYIWFDSVDVTTATNEEKEDIQAAIKEHIINYGSVQAAICSSSTYINFQTGAIYNNYSTKNADHAVSIVGWDDNYSKDNFNTSPSEDGAWIIRNSWGEKLEYTYDYLIDYYLNAGYTQTYIDENWDSIIANFVSSGYTNDEDNEVIYMNLGVSESDGGEGYGYFYVSYEDYTIYTNCEGIVSADDEVTYDSIYQLDEVGMVAATYLTQSNVYNTYLANVFTRTTTETEYLSSVGITSYASGTYEVYINPDGTSKASSDLEQVTFADGTTKITLSAGYNTIDFKESIELTGTNFVIVVKALTDEVNYTYFSVEYSSSDFSSTTATSNSGESFITYDATGFFDSDNWIDIGDTSDTTNYLGNLCIKGITTTSSTTSSTNTDNNSDSASTDEVVATNSDFSAATATVTNLEIASITGGDSTLDMTIQISGVVVEDEDQTFEQYFYLSTDSDADTSSVSDSNWAKVDSFEKQSDGTYTITLTVTEDSYLDDIDSSADYLYVYIKEIATKDSSTSTLITDGMIITATVNDDDDEDEVDTEDDEEEQEDNTTATSSLPYTGIKTILIIITIAGVCVIFTCAKYKSMNDIK